MKPSQGLFWLKKQRWLKTVPIGNEADVPLTHQLMVPLCKEIPIMLLE
jgi:hypothetical protein